MLLVAEEQLPSLVWRMSGSRAVRERAAGVLVIPASSPAALSPAPTFPLAEHAPYDDRGYAWNPHGADISGLSISAPIFLLDEATAAAALGHAAANAQKVGTQPACSWVAVATCQVLNSSQTQLKQHKQHQHVLLSDEYAQRSILCWGQGLLGLTASWLLHGPLHAGFQGTSVRG